MSRTMISIFTLGLLLGLSGCGTMENLRNNKSVVVYQGVPLDLPRPYGGVKKDLEACHDIWEKLPPTGWILTAPIIRSGCRLIDVPFSAVGDTVTLPFIENPYVWDKRPPLVEMPMSLEAPPGEETPKRN